LREMLSRRKKREGRGRELRILRKKKIN
jgi:hypothetical protein